MIFSPRAEKQTLQTHDGKSAASGARNAGNRTDREFAAREGVRRHEFSEVRNRQDFEIRQTFLGSFC